MSGKINIKGIDKTTLLRKLWEGMRPAAFFSQFPMPPPPFDEGAAQEAVKGYIDYFEGRCIKCDLSGDEVDPRMYDRDAGQGAFARIADSLR